MIVQSHLSPYGFGVVCKYCERIVRQGRYAILVTADSDPENQISGRYLAATFTCCGEERLALAVFDDQEKATLACYSMLEMLKAAGGDPEKIPIA